MARTRSVQQESSSDTRGAGPQGGDQQASPLLQMAGQIGNSAMLGMLGGLPGLGPAASALGGALGALGAGLTTPKTEYVDMTERQKTGYLVDLMDRSRGLLTANGVSPQMESHLAGIMGNEGSRNLRRKYLSDGMVSQAQGLGAKLKGVDLAALQSDPAKLQKFTTGLSEEQRHLFEQVKAGSLDLAALESKDPSVKQAAVAQITQAGITLRGDQYEEMTKLLAKQKEGALSKPEQARLTALKGLSGASKIGMSGKMGDLAGLSRERFEEIYAEGQQRFEPAQYLALKQSYEKSRARRKDPKKELSMSAGIGTFAVDAGMEGQLAEDYDLIADMATSYGTAQIMGAYAQAGLLSARGADGAKHTFTLAEMKESAGRLSPGAEDVQMQLAFMNMKGIDVSSKDLSAGTLTRKYNGSKPGTSQYNDYLSRLSSRSSAYDQERAARKKKA